jgi:2,4-dienoyl-CoA reductase-like NADH-dependent reductase (Old Yellow Enzyme family)/thioredoxin reductase
MASSDPLLQPFRLKHLTLRNRVMSTAHEPFYSEDAQPLERYRLYHVEKAKGGIALTMIGGSTVVAIDSPGTFGNIDASVDEVIPHYQALSEAVHAHGAAVMTQLTHMGARSTWAGAHWLPLVSASVEREFGHRTFAKEAEPEDLHRIAKCFGAAALRARQGGLDGVEILVNGHLIGAFLNPAQNQRTDGYGKDRTRFAIEVIEAIRAAVGPDYIVGLRIGLDHCDGEGITEADGLDNIARFSESGLVDFFNVNVGSPLTDKGIARLIPTMGTPFAPNIEKISRVRSVTGLPIFHAARIADVASARHALESGALDMVGMTRAHMADPHIVAKVARGEEDRIRPCVGTGYCIDQIYVAGATFCLHNPATGREARFSHEITGTAPRRRKVAIVGAGPAGLEAARVSALRGHEVVVFEAADRPGGQVLTAAQAPGRGDIIGITDWLAAEVAHAGIEIRFNHFAEVDDILAEEPDVVIIASGGIPGCPASVTGSDLAASGWDLLNGHLPPAGDVLIYDENGREQAPSLAAFLAAQGSKVEVVTPDRTFAAEIGTTNYPGVLAQIYRSGTKVTTDHKLTGLRRAGNRIEVTLFNEYSEQSHTRQVDQAVLEYGTRPADDLFFDLKPMARNGGQIDLDALVAGRPQELATNPDGAFQLFRVGDAVASRNIHAAIHDSRRLCLVL